MDAVGLSWSAISAGIIGKQSFAMKTEDRAGKRGIFDIVFKSKLPFGSPLIPERSLNFLI